MIYTLDEGVNKSKEQLQKGLLIAGALLLGAVATALVANSIRVKLNQGKQPLTISTVRGDSTEKNPPAAKSSNSQPTDSSNSPSTPGSPGQLSASTNPGYVTPASPRGSTSSVRPPSSAAPAVGGLGGGGGSVTAPTPSSPGTSTTPPPPPPPSSGGGSVLPGATLPTVPSLPVPCQLQCLQP